MVINGRENNAYDGGQYEFKISSISGLVGKTEDDVRPSWNGERTNFASTLDDFGEQGWNGWYYQYSYYDTPFFAINVELYDGNDGKYYTSDGVEIKRDYIVPSNKGKCAQVKWVAAESGRINIDLEYTKLLNEDANPNWPDGVTVKIWRNSKVIFTKKVEVKRSDGNNNVISFDFNKVSVKRGDKLSFQICADGNYAWDGGNLAVCIEPSKTLKLTPGDDNNTSLSELGTIEQGTDGWWFLEGSKPSGMKLLRRTNADGDAYLSRRTEALEMKPDYVHPGANRDPIYVWVAAKNGKVDVDGSYVKFGQNNEDASRPDGVMVMIWKNNKLLQAKQIKAKRGDGDHNAVYRWTAAKTGKVDVTVTFTADANTVDPGSNAFEGRVRLSGAEGDNYWSVNGSNTDATVVYHPEGGLNVTAGQELAFSVSHAATPGSGKLEVVIKPHSTEEPPAEERTNSANLASDFGAQGSNGWRYGTCAWNGADFTELTFDSDGKRYYNDGKPELKADFVGPGNGKNAAYQWTAAQAGTITVSGTYTKSANSDDGNADGTCMRIFLNSAEKKWLGGDIQGNFAEERSVSFNEEYAVSAGDVLLFAIDPDGNDAWDGGRFSVTITPKA